MKKALITGISGQAGAYLTQLLSSKGYEIYGLDRRKSDPQIDPRKKQIYDDANVKFVVGDITDPDGMRHLIKTIKPDEIYNLAAMSFVKSSWDLPVSTFDMNARAVVHLLEIIRQECPQSRMIQCSTSEMFGKVLETPQVETTPFYPRSPYGVSKCLTPATKIYTENGLVPISKIKIGDKVWAHDGQLHNVNKVYVREYEGELICITVSASSGGHNKVEYLQDNLQITCTPEHPILTDKGWINAGELTNNSNVLVVATSCKHCGKKIPLNRSFCSKECQLKLFFSDNNNRAKNKKDLIKAGNKLRKSGYWKSEEFKEAHTKGISRRLKEKGMNYMEYYTDLLIQKAAPGFFEFVGDGKYTIGSYFPDWVNIKKKAVIEFIGWGENYKPRIDRLNKKIQYYKNEGWKVLVLNGSEFRAPEEAKHKIAEFCASLGSVEYIPVKIKNIRKYNRTIKKKQNSKVYDLEIDNAHSFVANGVVVHNCSAHWATVNYRESYNLHASSAIMFNYESRFRGPEFVTRKITLAAARIKHGLQKELRLGNIEAKRDWSHAADTTRAMYLMAQQDIPSDYVICSGETRSIKEFLELAFSKLDMNWHDYVVIDSEFFRPAEVDLLQGNSAKAHNILGWKPEYTFDMLVEEMVKSDYDLIAKQKS